MRQGIESIDTAEKGILDVLQKHGPIGWYALEMRLAVPRQKFRDGYNMMNYIDDLIDADLVRKTDDGKFETVAAD